MLGNDESRNQTGYGIKWRGPAKNYEALSQLAAELIVEEIRRQPDLLLCAASGSTPIRCYELLAEKRQAEPQWFDRLRILKLDEWGGLPMDDPATCEAYLRRYLIQPLGISENRYLTFQSNPSDPQVECQRIRSLLAEHSPIDLCLLGLGLNGHLGLNEPVRSLPPFTHILELSESSKQHSMLDKATRQPEYGMTLGMAEILASRKIVLLVSGANKREPLGRLRSPQISTAFPASLLWLHRDVTCIYDRKAAEDSIEGYRI